MKKITKIGVNETLIQKKKLKVVAYCRVSTASDEQLISLEAQKAHYDEQTGIRTPGSAETASQDPVRDG